MASQEIDISGPTRSCPRVENADVAVADGAHRVDDENGNASLNRSSRSCWIRHLPFPQLPPEMRTSPATSVRQGQPTHNSAIMSAMGRSKNNML